MRPSTQLPRLVPLLFGLPLAVARSDDGVPAGEPRTVPRSTWQDPSRSGQSTRPASLEVDPLLLPSTSEPVQRAIGQGRAFLARQQTLTGDGSLTLGEEPDYDSPIGITALAALAWMAGGSGPSRGPHHEQVALAIDYLLSHQVDEDSEIGGYISDERDRRSSTHGHGLATLALAQAYSMSPQTPRGRRTAKALRLAVRRIEVSQSLEGGWYYDPRRSVEHEGSVTVCLVQGLRAARNVGVRVDKEVIDHAIEYVKGLQTEEGGFQYSPTQPRTSVALTAACLSTLHATGMYDGAAIKNGYDYVWRELGARELDREAARYSSQPAFPFYERFYLAQALWQHPDETVFQRWAETETQRVLTAQRKDGSWMDHRWVLVGEPVNGRYRSSAVDGRYGSAYATAINCLFLALPDGLLPIFQR